MHTKHIIHFTPLGGEKTQTVYNYDMAQTKAEEANTQMLLIQECWY